MEDHLTQDDVYWGSMLQIAEFVKNGITCMADMYFYPETVYEAAKTPIFASLCAGVQIRIRLMMWSNLSMKCTRSIVLCQTGFGIFPGFMPNTPAKKS